MTNYTQALLNAIDGRSLKSETVRRVFDPTYKIGSNQTIDALKYLQKLPEMVGEYTAINFIEIVANHRAIGWKSLANVVDLVMTHCSEDPAEILDEIIAVVANRMMVRLDDGSSANVGGDAISAMLFKRTGHSINEGRFSSSRSDAMVEKQKIRRTLDTKIINRLKHIDPDSRDAVLLRDVLGIESKNIVPLIHLVQVLTDEAQSA